LSQNVPALTANEIFSLVSDSTILVHSYGSQGNIISQGSGVVVGKEVVVTNCHVIKNSTSIEVSYKGLDNPAKLLHSDWKRDICSLTVAGLSATPVSLGNTSQISPGSRVYAVGA